MKPSRPVSDHHWLAFWLVLVGAALAAFTDVGGMFCGVLMGAGFVWLAMVE